MKVLVTGGAGYVGSVVTEELVKDGHEVVVYDSLYRGRRDAIVKGAEFVQADLADVATLQKTLSAHRIEAVVHLAADSLVAESCEQPAKYYRNNVVNGLVLLDAMREANVDRIVFSSSAATYGQPDKQPIEESAPTQPTNPSASPSSRSSRRCAGTAKPTVCASHRCGISTPRARAQTAARITPTKHISSPSPFRSPRANAKLWRSMATIIRLQMVLACAITFT